MLQGKLFACAIIWDYEKKIEKCTTTTNSIHQIFASIASETEAKLQDDLPGGEMTVDSVPVALRILKDQQDTLEKKLRPFEITGTTFVITTTDRVKEPPSAHHPSPPHYEEIVDEPGQDSSDNDAQESASGKDKGTNVGKDDTVLPTSQANNGKLDDSLDSSELDFWTEETVIENDKGKENSEKEGKDEGINLFTLARMTRQLLTAEKNKANEGMNSGNYSGIYSRELQALLQGNENGICSDLGRTRSKSQVQGTGMNQRQTSSTPEKNSQKRHSPAPSASASHAFDEFLETLETGKKSKKTAPTVSRATEETLTDMLTKLSAMQKNNKNLNADKAELVRRIAEESEQHRQELRRQAEDAAKVTFAYDKLQKEKDKAEQVLKAKLLQMAEDRAATTQDLSKERKARLDETVRAKELNNELLKKVHGSTDTAEALQRQFHELLNISKTQIAELQERDRQIKQLKEQLTARQSNIIPVPASSGSASTVEQGRQGNHHDNKALNMAAAQVFINTAQEKFRTDMCFDSHETNLMFAYKTLALSDIEKYNILINNCTHDAKEILANMREQLGRDFSYTAIRQLACDEWPGPMKTRANPTLFFKIERQLNQTPTQYFTHLQSQSALLLKDMQATERFKRVLAHFQQTVHSPNIADATIGTKNFAEALQTIKDKEQFYGIGTCLNMAAAQTMAFNNHDTLKTGTSPPPPSADETTVAALLQRIMAAGGFGAPSTTPPSSAATSRPASSFQPQPPARTQSAATGERPPSGSATNTFQYQFDQCMKCAGYGHIGPHCSSRNLYCTNCEGHTHVKRVCKNPGGDLYDPEEFARRMEQRGRRQQAAGQAQAQAQAQAPPNNQFRLNRGNSGGQNNQNAGNYNRRA